MKTLADLTYNERLMLCFRYNRLDQVSFAKKLGIARTTAGAMLRGEIPGHKHLDAIANALGVKVEFLTHGINPPKWALEK